MANKVERVELRLNSDMVDEIDLWNENNYNGSLTRAESIRKLVSDGINTRNNKKLFELMRMSIIMSKDDDEISPAQIYAWRNRLYPICDSDESIQDAFKRDFNIGYDKMSDLLILLDQKWLNKEMVSFYELEDIYDVRKSSSSFSRSDLIHALRYFYLHGTFDENFWNNGIKKQYGYPIEAGIITKK